MGRGGVSGVVDRKALRDPRLECPPELVSSHLARGAQGQSETSTGEPNTVPRGLGTGGCGQLREGGRTGWGSPTWRWDCSSP